MPIQCSQKKSNVSMFAAVQSANASLNMAVTDRWPCFVEVDDALQLALEYAL